MGIENTGSVRGRRAMRVLGQEFGKITKEHYQKKRAESKNCQNGTLVGEVAVRNPKLCLSDTCCIFREHLVHLCYDVLMRRSAYSWLQLLDESQKM